MDAKPGFWKRQFDDHPSSGQKYADVVLGILAPLVCVIADPCVFRSEGRMPVWIPYATGAYIFIALEILALIAWMTIPRKGPLLSVALAGTMFAGALASLGLGIRMLPLSLIGLIAIIGILGFTPFATAFVFLRNAVRAWRAAGTQEFRWEIAAFLALLPMGLGALGEWQSDRALKQLILHPDPVAAAKLAKWLQADRADEVLFAWEREQNPERKSKLAKTYRELTGRDIEERQATLRD